MASVFVVRSRRPLLHYYSYPARRGYRRTAGNCSRIRWIKPTCILREREGKLGPSTRAVCTLEVLPSMSRRRRAEGRAPHFFPRAHVNQSGTICRPSSGRTHEVRVQQWRHRKKCLSVQPTFRARVYRRQLRRAALSGDETSERAGAIFSFNGRLYRK